MSIELAPFLPLCFAASISSAESVLSSPCDPGSISSMSAYEDLSHTGAAYSAIEYHRTSAVDLRILAFVPHSELANFFNRLLPVATFMLKFCMYCLFVTQRTV